LEAERKYRQAEAVYCHAIRIQERAMNIRAAEDPFMHSPRLMLAALYPTAGEVLRSRKAVCRCNSGAGANRRLWAPG